MDGCDFTNTTEVQLNRHMFQKLVDISDCNWKPMLLPIYDFRAVPVFRANRASVIGLPYEQGVTPLSISLLSISLDNNAMANVDPTSNLQSIQFATLVFAAPALASFSCVNCSLEFNLADFTQYCLFAAKSLQVVKLARNNIQGGEMNHRTQRSHTRATRIIHCDTRPLAFCLFSFLFLQDRSLLPHF
jgi:hypothetical protein